MMNVIQYLSYGPMGWGSSLHLANHAFPHWILLMSASCPRKLEFYNIARGTHVVLMVWFLSSMSPDWHLPESHSTLNFFLASHKKCLPCWIGLFKYLSWVLRMPSLMLFLSLPLLYWLQMLSYFRIANERWDIWRSTMHRDSWVGFWAQ